MSDDLHKYPGNLKHYNVDEATVTHLRIIADQAELIQRLVDGWFANDNGEKMVSAINEAISAGFKPSEQ